MPGFKVDSSGVKAMTRALEREFAKRPVRVPVVVGGSGSAADTTLSEADLVAGWLLDWLWAYANEHRGTIPTVQDLVEATKNDELAPMVERHADAAVDALVEANLIERDPGPPRGMSEHIRMTAAGRLEALARIGRRSNNKERRAACREALLRWAYEQEAETRPVDLALMIRTPYGWYNGVPYEVSDLTAAAQFLREAGLVTGADTCLSLTEDGITCIEQYGDVVTFLRRADSVGGVAVVIQGDNNGQLAVANRDVTQRQEQALDPRVLQVFAQALRELADLLPEQSDDLRDVASSLDSEAKKEAPDRAWVGALLRRARELLEKANKFGGVAQLAGLGLQLFSITQGLIG